METYRTEILRFKRTTVCGILGICTVLILQGCREARPGELPGRYAFSASWGQATLILRPNLTMEQEVRPRSGDLKRISGTWKFAGDFLLLKPCLHVDRQAQGEAEGWCNYGVEVPLSGDVQIRVDFARDLAYQKVGGY